MQSAPMPYWAHRTIFAYSQAQLFVYSCVRSLPDTMDATGGLTMVLTKEEIGERIWEYLGCTEWGNGGPNGIRDRVHLGLAGNT